MIPVLLGVLLVCAIYALLFGIALLLVIFLGMIGNKPVPDMYHVAFIYSAGILFGLALKPLFLEFSTGKIFGSVPCRNETKFYRIVAMIIVNLPHAVFFAWGAAFLGWAPTFPNWFVMIGALAVLVTFTLIRAKLRINKPVRSCSFPHADDLAEDDPICQEACKEIEKGQILEAIKCLRHKKGLDAHCAIHTVRKLRYQISQRKQNQDQSHKEP